MAVIRGDVAASMLPDAIVLDLGDLIRQGKALMERAEAEAEAIVDQARIERARLLAGASEQGLDEGRASGFAQGLDEGRRVGHAEAIESTREQAMEVVQAWQASLQAFETARAKMIDAAREDVIRFAVAFAERVTRRMIQLDPRAIEPIIADALGLVMAGSTISVRLASADAELAREVIGPILERLGHSRDAEIVEDAALQRGACVVRTQAGVIDASVEVMIERMVRQLLPDDPASATAERAENAASPADPSVETPDTSTDADTPPHSSSNAESAESPGTEGDA